MADAVQINVFPRQGSWVRYTLAQLGFWLPIASTVWFTETVLSGSWVANTLALFAGVVYFLAHVSMSTGEYAKLSREEVIKWVGDGAPADVKSWKEGQ